MSPSDLVTAARQISTSAPDFSAALFHLIESTPPTQRAELIATLEREACATLDQQPRAARDWAQTAYELARATDEPRARATTALTYTIALNRLGEFCAARAASQHAESFFNQLDQRDNAARARLESAWAKIGMGDLTLALADVTWARDLVESPSIHARGDWIHARILRGQANYADAQTLFEHARAFWQTAGLPLEAARCEFDLAYTRILNETPNELPRVAQLRQTFQTAQCPLEVAACDYLTALALRFAHRYSDAMEIAATARRAFVDLRAEYHVAESDLLIGMLYARTNRYEQALTTLRACHDYFRANSLRVSVSASAINLGNVLYTLNRYNEALTLYQEAAELTTNEGRATRDARVLINIGMIYLKQGRFAHTLDAHQRALAIATRHNLAMLAAGSHQTLAMCHRELGQYAEALTHLNQVRAICVERDLRDGLVVCDINLAELHLARGDRALATACLESARQLACANQMDSQVAMCDRLLAQTQSGMVSHEQSLARLASARARFHAQTQMIDVALCDLAEGELRLQWNELAPAEESFARARVALTPGFPDYAWRAESGIGRCARARNDRATALAHLSAAVREIATVRAALVMEQFSDVFFAQRQSVYDDALALAAEQNDAPAALDIIEASKARAFLALIQSRGWQARRADVDGYTAGLIARERQLCNDLQTLRQHITVQTNLAANPLWRGNASELANTAAREELNALSAQYEAVVTQLRLATRGLAGAPAPAPFALAEFRATMQGAFGDDWCALDYALNENQIVIVVVSPQDTRIFCKPLTAYDRKILEQCAAVEPDLRERIYRGTVRGARVPFSDKPLRHLYRLLVPPDMDASTLILAPHRALHNLPFHALRDDTGYLIEKHAIVYTPSFQILTSLMTDSPDGSTGNSALVCGLATFGDDLRDLPHAETEVNSLRALFDPEKLLWGADATRQALLDLNNVGALQKFDVLHFATHALLDRAAPHQSRIVLSDAPLTTFDILDLTLNARLVTLSACQTALGKNGDGDELIGLARAFFYAGARALLATLWHVEDDSTTDLVTRVYQHFARGENLAAALRGAQIEMIRAGRSPYQWAPFVLMGQP